MFILLSNWFLRLCHFKWGAGWRRTVVQEKRQDSYEKQKCKNVENGGKNRCTGIWGIRLFSTLVLPVGEADAGLVSWWPRGDYLPVLETETGLVSWWPRGDFLPVEENGDWTRQLMITWSLLFWRSQGWREMTMWWSLNGRRHRCWTQSRMITWWSLLGRRSSFISGRSRGWNGPLMTAY